MLTGLAYVLFSAYALGSPFDGPEKAYQNSDAPNCGSFHTGKIQGVVRSEIREPLENVRVTVFDDASHKFLAQTTTDRSGRFSFLQVWNGRLRVVFDSPGRSSSDLAVTMKGREGLLPGRKISEILYLPVGDRVAICRSDYTK